MGRGKGGGDGRGGKGVNLNACLSACLSVCLPFRCAQCVLLVCVLCNAAFLFSVFVLCILFGLLVFAEIESFSCQLKS